MKEPVVDVEVPGPVPNAIVLSIPLVGMGVQRRLKPDVLDPG